MRGHILDAAAVAFGRAGYHRTSMEEIAVEAGFAVGTIYNHFKSKEGLYDAIVETMAGELDAARRRPMPSGLNFWQRLELTFLRYFEVLERKRSWMTTLLAEQSGFDPRGRPSPSQPGGQVIAATIEFLASEIRAGVETGEVRSEDDPVALAHMIVGMLHARVDWWVRARPVDGSLVEQCCPAMRFVAEGLGRVSPPAHSPRATRQPPGGVPVGAPTPQGSGASRK